LPPNCRPISGSDAVVSCFDDVHGYLPRESDGAGVAANLQILFAQVEVLADAFLNQIDGDALSCEAMMCAGLAARWSTKRSCR
jgi:hypothetical protein